MWQKSGPTWRQALGKSDAGSSRRQRQQRLQCCQTAWFFCVGVALIEGQFHVFHGLYDSNYLANRKGIVLIHSVNQCFDVFFGFPTLMSTATKSWTSVLALTGGISRDCCCWPDTGGKTADWTSQPQRRTVREKLSPHILFSCNLSNFYYIGAITPCTFDSNHTLYVDLLLNTRSFSTSFCKTL